MDETEWYVNFVRIATAGASSEDPCYYNGMTYTEFLQLCDNRTIEPDSAKLPRDQLLLALWHDYRGHWVVAHRIAQAVGTPEGSALHAYLHREEGDNSNALYWYSRAGRSTPDVSLEEEWETLAKELTDHT